MTEKSDLPELEPIYLELLNSPVTKTLSTMDQSLAKTFRPYFANMTKNTLRSEMDYFVSCCVDIGINLCSIVPQEEQFQYDYITYFLGTDQGRRRFHSRLMTAGPTMMYPHRHDYYELMYVLSGSLCQQVDDQWITMKTNDMLLLDMNTVHTEQIADSALVQYLQIPRSVIEGILREEGLSGDLMNFFSMPQQKRGKKLRHVLFVHRHEGTKIRDLLMHMILQREGNRPGSRYIIYGLLIQLLYAMEQGKEYRNSYYSKEADGEDSLYNQLCQYLEDHHWSASPEELERDLHYSPSYLNKVMRKSTDRSITEYCVEKRLEKAAELLYYTDLSVNDVITQCGYQNKTYFYRVFRNKYGVSPMEFRKNKKETS